MFDLKVKQPSTNHILVSFHNFRDNVKEITKNSKMKMMIDI